MILTADGSHSYLIPELQVTCHSAFGTIKESKQVFIDAGVNFLFNSFKPQPLEIFEMSFCTGLNVIEAGGRKSYICYTAVEQLLLGNGIELR